MRILSRLFAVVFGLSILIGAGAGTAEASVEAKIDLAAQRMKVYVDGALAHEFAISSGKRGFSTPTGNYSPYRIHHRWFSRKYNNAPMHRAVFFSGGYAIHATTEVGRLGRPASHGCIRLHPANADTFYNLVRERGMGATRISLFYGDASTTRVASSEPFKASTQRRAVAKIKAVVASSKPVVTASRKTVKVKVASAKTKPLKASSAMAYAPTHAGGIDFPMGIFRGTLR